MSAQLSAAQVERVLIDAVSLEPDTECIDTDSWVQMRTPSSPLSNHNSIFLARLHPSEVSTKVAEVAAEHRARRASVRWIVGPSSEPATIGQQLQAAGFTKESSGIGMTFPCQRELPSPLPPGLTLEPLTADNLEDYAQLAARAWQKGDDFADAIRRIHLRLVTEHQPTSSKSLSWMAHLDGTPVAVSHLRLLPNVGYLQGAAVLPSHRGRGLYRALIAHRVGVIAQANRASAVIWADTRGASSVCKRAGFTEVTRAEFYLLDPSPP